MHRCANCRNTIEGVQHIGWIADNSHFEMCCSPGCVSERMHQFGAYFVSDEGESYGVHKYKYAKQSSGSSSDSEESGRSSRDSGSSRSGGSSSESGGGRRESYSHSEEAQSERVIRVPRYIVCGSCGAILKTRFFSTSGGCPVCGSSKPRWNDLFTSDTMTCVECGKKMPSDYEPCPNCHKLPEGEATCSKCGLSYSSHKKACPVCGEKSWAAQALNEEIKKLYEEARELHKNGNTGGAIKKQLKALELDPQHINGLLALGFYYRKNGDIEKAIPALDRAVKAAPNTAAAYGERGECYYAKGLSSHDKKDFGRAGKDFQRAVADFKKAGELDPGKAWYKNRLDAAQSFVDETPEDRAQDDAFDKRVEELNKEKPGFGFLAAILEKVEADSSDGGKTASAKSGKAPKAPAKAKPAPAPEEDTTDDDDWDNLELERPAAPPASEQAEAAFCSECGAKLKSGAKFCGKCGAKV